jgi:hypothetical protein
VGSDIRPNKVGVRTEDTGQVEDTAQVEGTHIESNDVEEVVGTGKGGTHKRLASLRGCVEVDKDSRHNATCRDQRQ